MKNIMLVEDNEGDILLTTVILNDIDPEIQLDVAREGEQAIQMLEMMKIKGVHARPELILLDVNLPKKNGFEILNHIRSDVFFDQTPVVMLTTSSFSKDRMQAFENKADDFLTKSSELSEFQSTIKKIYENWVLAPRMPHS